MVKQEDSEPEECAALSLTAPPPERSPPRPLQHAHVPFATLAGVVDAILKHRRKVRTRS